MRGKLARTVLRGPHFREEMRLPSHDGGRIVLRAFEPKEDAGA
jgi:hypothetical protein